MVGDLAVQHLIDLFVKLLFDFRVPGQQVPGPGKRQSSSLLAGEKERNHFVAQLLVSHLAAILVLGSEQHRKQVAFIAATRPPFSDDPIDDLDQFLRPAYESAGGQESATDYPESISELPGKRTALPTRQ